MKKMLEKVLKSELVFPGRFLKIWRDDVELPNGFISFREYLKHPGAAMVIPETASGRYLMIYQYRHAVGQIFLEFPAGKRDKGENSTQTAFRELQEEVGFKPGELKFLTHIHPVIGYSNERIDLFLAKNLIPTPMSRDPDEVLEIIELSFDEILQKVWNHEITDVKTQIGVFWLQKYLKGELKS